MAEVTTQIQTNNMLVTDYDTSKLLLGFNEFIDGTITAAAGSGILTSGMVMGRVAATGKVTPVVAAAVDGSQYPIGVCIQTKTVADGATALVPMVNKGRVAESFIDFLGAETLDSTVGPANNLRTYRDLLNDLGLILMGGIELTAVDNH